MTGDVVYRKDKFIIFRAGTGLVVYNTDKEFEHGHSHLKSLKSGKDAIIFVQKGKIPKDCRNYYLITLMRLSMDNKYIEEIQSLMDVRGQKGKSQVFTTNNGNVRGR